MTKDQHLQQTKRCFSAALFFTGASFACHILQRLLNWSWQLDYTFLWSAVLFVTLGCIHHVKSGNAANSSIES